MGLYLTEKHVKYKKKSSDEYVSPFFIYHNDSKRTKIFCSLKINNKYWDFTNKKVKSGDKEYKSKNQKKEDLPRMNPFIQSHVLFLQLNEIIKMIMKLNKSKKLRDLGLMMTRKHIQLPVISRVKLFL